MTHLCQFYFFCGLNKFRTRVRAFSIFDKSFVGTLLVSTRSPLRSPFCICLSFIFFLFFTNTSSSLTQFSISLVFSMLFFYNNIFLCIKEWIDTTIICFTTFILKSLFLGSKIVENYDL